MHEEYPPRITYLTESKNFITMYNNAVTAADSFPALHELKKQWGKIFPSIKAVIDSITLQNFDEYRKGLMNERMKEFSGEDWVKKYGEISMPSLAVKASLLSRKYEVPWGCAYIRLAEELGMNIDKFVDR